MKQDKQKSLALIDEVGLSHRANHLPKQMSGGEKQRAAIARSLIVEPKLLLADEPTGHLDSKTSQNVFDLFAKLNEEKKVTIIVATHNEQLGSQTRRIIKLRDGKIVNE